MSLHEALTGLSARLLDPAQAVDALSTLALVAGGAADNPATPPDVADVLRPIPRLVLLTSTTGDVGAADEIGTRLSTAIRLLGAGAPPPGADRTH